MKHLLTLTIATIAIVFSTRAQTALPYSTGFDTPGEETGWTIFRSGCDTFMSWQNETDYGVGFTPPSPPNCINHDYPEGATLTDDWLISPSLDMTTGADASFKICVFSANYAFGSITTLAPGDTIEMYLLKGSPDPTIATKVLLASFGHASMLDSNGTHFKDTTGISVPATAGGAYIAFRYTCINDWFQIGVDDVNITPVTGTAVVSINNTKNDLFVYPNPVKETLKWDYTDAKLNSMEGHIVDISGRIFDRVQLKDKQLDLHTLKPGAYFLKSAAGSVPFVKE